MDAQEIIEMDAQEIIEKLEKLAIEKLNELRVAALIGGAQFSLRVRMEIGSLHEFDVLINGAPPPDGE